MPLKRYIRFSDGTILDREKITSVTADPQIEGRAVVKCDNGDIHWFDGADGDIARDAFVEDDTPHDPAHVWKDKESESDS